MKTLIEKNIEELSVCFDVNTVSVYPHCTRHSKRTLVVGPFEQTPANIRYCNAIVDAANTEYKYWIQALTTPK